MFRAEQLEVTDLVAIQSQTRVVRAFRASKIASRLLENNSFFDGKYLIKAKKRNKLKIDAC